MKYTGPNWQDVIKRHKDEYKRREDAKFKQALRMYRGDPWTQEERGSPLRRVSFNMLFAIVESATAATVPNNLQFTVYKDPKTTETAWEAYLANADRDGDWSGEACLSMVDAMLTGRSILKVSPGKPWSQIRAVDPRRVFFDLTVRRPRDIGYFIELCPMTLDELESKLKGRKPVYQLPESITDIKALQTSYPEWLSEAANKTGGDVWIPVWEVVDVNRKTVTHWIENVDQPLCMWTGDDYFNPYCLYNLNLDGEDCRGLSEVQLVEETVTAINRILVYWAEIVRKQLPITLYDTAATNEDEMKRVTQASPGALVGINASGKSLASVFANLPVAPVPPDMINFMLKLEQIVAYVSATSDMARGQTVGAKTATELALIQAKDQNRIQHRVARFNRAWEGAAMKALELAKVEFPDLPAPSRITMIAYSPIEKNREVLRERFLQAYGIMSARPDQFDQAEVDRLFAEINNLPMSVLKAATATPTPEAASPELPPAPTIPEPATPTPVIPTEVSNRLSAAGAAPEA